MFGPSDTTLSGFISTASADDLTAIALQVFGRVGSLNPEQQKLFMGNLKRNLQAKRVLERMTEDQSW